MTRKEIEIEIRAILGRVTESDVSNVGLDDDLSTVTGIDSLGRLELLSEVEETFGFTIYDLDTNKTASIEGMLEIVEKALLEAV